MPGETRTTRILKDVTWAVTAVTAMTVTVLLAAVIGTPSPPEVVVPPSVGESGGAVDLDFDRIRGHIARLCESPSRMTGREGAGRAADYILSELRKLGLGPGDVETQEFEVAVPGEGECVLSADTRAGTVRIPLHPLWPNLARTCKTGPEGLTGPLVDVGKGTDDDLASHDLRDALVVMDWDSEDEWLAVPEFGGKAVIFRGSVPASGYASRRKFLTVPAAIQRFYVAREDVPALERLARILGATPDAKARITAEVAWRRATGRNILARLSGDDVPADETEPNRRAIVFRAYYDSVSVVPDLTPGAEQSCGAATLLELGRFLAALPAKPERPVCLLFTGGHGQALAGMTRFVRALHEEPGSERAAAPGSLIARMGKPALFVGLDLTSHSERMGVFCQGHFRAEAESVLRPKFSALGLKLAEFAAGTPVAGEGEVRRGSFVRAAGMRLLERLSALVTGKGASRPAFVDCINTQGRGWWTYFPYRVPFESELPTLAGMPSVTLATVNDDRRLVDTPGDVVEALALGGLRRQVCASVGGVGGLANIAVALAFWKGPFTAQPVDDKLARITGRAVWLDQERNFTPNEPLHGATVFLKTGRGDKHLVGTRGVPAAITDAEGDFEFDGLINISGNREFSRCTLEGYGTAAPEFIESNAEAYDELLAARSRGGEPVDSIPMDGSVVYAVDMARAGEYPWTTGVLGAEQSVNLVCFPCRTITLYGLTDPRGYLDLRDLVVLDATTQGSPFQFGKSASDMHFASSEGMRMTLWADPTIRVRLTLGHGFQEKRLVLIKNSPEDPVGEGFGLDEFESIPSMILQGADDMRRLDQSRADKLERHGVSIPRVKRIRGESREYLETARAALASGDYRTYRGASEKGWALESKAYGELLSMTNNMIKGVLFYLALLLPFSYCLERILVASGTVRKRIIWMTVIFTTSFAVLAFIHPAFRFTLTPLIVLLAFVILALAATVSVLVVGKFDSMLRERKQALTGAHEDNVSTANIAVRAIDLGIANIRRRPRRGLLTGVTIVLVTFTLLSFTAIIPTVTVSRLSHPSGNPTYKGLLARDRAWAPLPIPLYHSLKRTFEKAGAGEGTSSVVAGRAWYFSDFSGRVSRIDLAACQDPNAPEGAPRAAAAGDGPDASAADFGPARGAGHFTVTSLVCLEHTEPAVTGVDEMLVAGRWFRDEDDLGVILPAHVAKFMGVDASNLGREVALFGQRLPVIGIIDEKAFDRFKDLDGEPLTPVDFVNQEQLAAQRTAEEQADTLEDYVHHATDQVAIVPLKLGRRLGASLRSVAVRTAPHIVPETEAEGYVTRSNQTILACNGRRVTLYAALDTSRLSVAGQVSIPVLLGFIMVLGTMLGSVYERKNEIFVYSSVGLPPVSVSSLFLAESCVYAIVGACMGYLSGQVVSKVLLETGALSGLSLNYSAGSTVFVALLTMFIVLVSTLYPARQAFYAAIPGTAADEGEDAAAEIGGDELGLYLPFVATPSSIFGMQAYMHEFLEGLEGLSVGTLAVDDLAASVAVKAGRPVPVLSFRAWIAPFDLGVSYDTRFRLDYREERGVYQFHLYAARASGDQQNWKRLTPRFILVLRKQLLMWRILSPEGQRRYEERGRALFGYTGK
ncbi:MAG: FtsX-like permease family protein [Planctomycetota bacterium]